MRADRAAARPWRARAARGLSLVELMVALVIGLVLSLAVSTVLTGGEAIRRTTTGLNDLNQSSTVIAYLLDRHLRSAGSGFAQRWRETWGCRLHAVRQGAQILPRPAGSTFPAPFQGVPGTLGLAPLLIGQGLAPGDGGDVLVVMAGTGGLGDVPMRALDASATATGLRLPTTLGLRAGDLVLVADPTRAPCLVQQVDAAHVAGSGQDLPFGGRHAAAAVAGVALDTFTTSGRTLVTHLGHADDNRPLLQLVGVGPGASLFTHDLLRPDGDVALPWADGVVALRAVYGVTDVGNAAGTVDAWVAADPADPVWSLAALSAGTPAAREALRRIVAVRVALVLRSAQPQADDVAPPSLTLFGDLPAALRRTHALDADARRLHHRVVDFTVPLRAVQLQSLP